MSRREEAPHPSSERHQEVWRALGGVTDPELDESVTEMGFVTDVDLRDGDEVYVSFRLPTYWCAPNFAFMMGEDMRRAVLAVEWVRRARVVLAEHLCAEAINRGVNENLSFKDAFGAEATGDLDELRQKFLRKAFEWRQEALLTHLLKCGTPADVLVGWTVAELMRESGGDAEIRSLAGRYLDRRDVAGAFTPSAPAFVRLDGALLDARDLPGYLRSIRRVRTNAEFNGALCRGLLAERNGAAAQALERGTSAAVEGETAIEGVRGASPCRR